MDPRKEPDLHPEPADSDPLLGGARASATPPPDAGSSHELEPLRGSPEISECGKDVDGDNVDDDDIEAASAPCCRICLECDNGPVKKASVPVLLLLLLAADTLANITISTATRELFDCFYTEHNGVESWLCSYCNMLLLFIGGGRSKVKNLVLLICIFGEDLISPCMCKGTQQFVHRSCLDHWRSVKEGFAFSHCTTCKAQFHLRIEYLEDYSWRKIKFRIFVARDVLLVFLAVQTVIATIGGLAFILDRNGTFRNSFDDGWDHVLSKHPIPFYYCLGVLIFFVLLGFFGLVLHCSSLNNNDPCMAGCRNCCYGWGVLDCFPASMEACFALIVVFVVVFAILGIAYSFLAATMAIQRIWQRHYHILTKKELTKEYVVEDLRGCYSSPKLDPEHEQRLKLLKLM